MILNNNDNDNSAKRFFKWAYNGRAETVKNIDKGIEYSHEKIFLSFTSHNPAFVSSGSKGLNASIKGIGYLPKKQYLQEILPQYIEHINSYHPEDKDYSKRGLKLLIKHLYSEEAEKNIDFKVLSSIEMAFVHSWYNYQENPEATLLFYQPPAISYELRGKMEIKGTRYDKDHLINNAELDIYQQFVNAQHDCYHMPNQLRWKTRPVYLFHIEEIYDNSVSKNGFGKKLEI